MDYKNINDYELIYMIRENDSDKNIVFNKYKPLVESIAKECYKKTNKSIDLDDLIQEGYKVS